MANLDARFFCTSDLDTYYVDNASGLPMSGGIITFYSDINRTVLKPVYQLTGTPGNYSYTPLNNPITLSSSGTIQDALGNNIVPYYYPFTGTPAEDTGDQELYYVVCVNSGFVPQFVRQGWPQAAGEESPFSDEEIDNFIPNGQFLAHNNIVSLIEPPVSQISFGTQTIDIQPIAQGGWYFAYTDGTNATFGNSFSQIPASGGWGINSFPKYLFNFVCSNIGSVPLTRDLWITWPDINKFSSGNPPGSTPYTLFFDARSNDSNAYTFMLYQIYYFGTGGTPGTSFFSEPIATITIGPGATLASVNIQEIMWLVNQGEIGTNGDDFVGLALRGPASGFNISVSDFVLAQGNEEFTSYPVTTNDQMLSRSVTGFMPTPDPAGGDLYLPLILTPQGMKFDTGQISDIIGKTSLANFTNSISTVNNELLCDGSQYQANQYSPLGIPYSRLAAALYDPVSNVPIFGTGVNWVNCYSSSGANQLIFTTNKIAAPQTNPADGTGSLATGFTFESKINTGTAGFQYNAYSNGAGIVTAISTFTAGPYLNGGVGTGTSGLNVSNYTTPLIADSYFIFLLTAQSASALAAGSGNPGLYFTFASSTTAYYFWFVVNGETDPAVGGRTGIRCRLTSTMTAQDVGSVIAAVLTGYQENPVTVTGQPTNGAGSYFTFNSNGLQTAVWYQVDNVGTQPAGFISYVMVPIASTDSATTVTGNTQKAINSAYFAVPNLQGVFLRGWDPNNIWDLDIGIRFSPDSYLSAALPGSFEVGQVISHFHTLNSTATAGSTTQGGSGNVGQGSSGFYGGAENRPVNMYIGYAIKY